MTAEPLRTEALDFSDLEAKYSVDSRLPMDRFVVVDGCPVVPESKLEALTKVLKKVFSKAGPLKRFHMPLNPDSGKTFGAVFLEFESEEGARNAVQAYNGKKLDARHTMHVDRLAHAEKLVDGDEGKGEFKEPQVPPFKPLPHLRSWLTDNLGRDQAVLHIDDLVTVAWFRKDSAPQQVMRREHFTDGYVQWSPKGTYLLSVHPQGVVLHAGPDFEVIGRFPHREARLVDFSPDERFLVTGSREPIPSPPEDPAKRATWPFKETDEGNHIVFWSVQTMTPLRTFAMPPQIKRPPLPVPIGAPAPTEEPSKPWPAFKWSADSRYFARISANDTLAIYDSKTMGLVDRKPMRTQGIIDFDFAPALIKGRPLLAYWTPEHQNQTARVCLVDAATKEVVRNRSLFNVVRCRFHWQDEGRFLACRIDRLTKNKKAVFSSLEIYRLFEKDQPVEVIDLKETVIDFAWESHGDRFAIISYREVPGHPISTSKNILSFYALERSKGLQGTWKEANRLTDRSSASIHWCPTGRFLVTACFKASKPLVEFWDCDHDSHIAPATNGATPEAKNLDINVCPLATNDHAGITDVVWDPSGRYVASLSAMHPGGHQGYNLWDISGKLLRGEKIDRLKAFFWRPRPASILPEDKKKEIAKNIKEIAADFDTEDATLASEESTELKRKRESLIKSWNEWRAEIASRLLALGKVPEEERLEVRDGKVYVITEDIVEEEEEVEV